MKKAVSIADVRLWLHWLAGAVTVLVPQLVKMNIPMPEWVKTLVTILSFLTTSGVIGSAFATDPKQSESTP